MVFYVILGGLVLVETLFPADVTLFKLLSQRTPPL